MLAFSYSGTAQAIGGIVVEIILLLTTRCKSALCCAPALVKASLAMHDMQVSIQKLTWHTSKLEETHTWSPAPCLPLSAHKTATTDAVDITHSHGRFSQGGYKVCALASLLLLFSLCFRLLDAVSIVDTGHDLHCWRNFPFAYADCREGCVALVCNDKS